MSKRQFFLSFAAALLLPCVAASGYAQSKSPLSAGAARNVIRRAEGIELPSAAVRVKSLSSPDKLTVDVLAQIGTAFRFVKEKKTGWRIAEIRTGDNRWEEIGLILRALNVEEMESACSETSPDVNGAEESDPGVRQARCLIAELAGIELPSDAVRVKSVSALSLGDIPSAVVEAVVEAEFRLSKGSDKKWRVARIKTGSGGWADVELLVNGINEQKRTRAREELETVAAALEAFRRERGFYVEAQTERALVDHLNPRYLRRVIRIDPWLKPYQYEGTRNSYTLRSNGADGQPNTSDDIVKTMNAER
ncbi:MAG TPA: type II secretion system protein GspG [Pyrinomonadaceae bacterium]|jgi:hypothetical protein